MRHHVSNLYEEHKRLKDMLIGEKEETHLFV